MTTLPIELWAQIAQEDIQIYRALVQVVRGLGKVHLHSAPSWEDHFTVKSTDELGTQRWKLHGKFHRGDGQPAVIYASGGQEWWLRGKLHRDNDEPAVIYAGFTAWFQHSALHRDGDKPAIVRADDHQEWWHHGILQTTVFTFLQVVRPAG